MHRLLLSRVLGNACCSANSGGITNSAQAWDGALKVCWLPSYNSVQLYSSNLKILLNGECPQASQDQNKSLEKLVTEKTTSGAANCKLAKMDSVAGISGEGKAKRTREFVSPLRVAGSKKKVKGIHLSDKEPPLICLDDIPLPSKDLKPSKKKKKKLPSLEFIPLPPGSPPPLPPPLPSPPPPPNHTEMDEVLADFFIIDTTASSSLFPLPLPPGHITNSGVASKLSDTTTSNRADVSHSGDSDPDEISVLYTSDSLLPEQFKNINLGNRSKGSGQSVRRKTSDADKIDIVFDGQWPWVIKSPESLTRGQEKQLLSVNSTLSGQVRHCHSTKQGLKTIERSPEPELATSVETSEPDIITLETGTSSILGRASPKDFLSLNTNGTSVLGEGETEIITLEPLTRKEKTAEKLQKRKEKENTKPHKRKEFHDKEKNSSREVSPDIQKVDIIDPDVLEIENTFPSSSNCTNFEVVDVYESEDEVLDDGVPSDQEDRYSVNMEDVEDRNSVNMEDLDVIDMCEGESDKESSADSSDHEEPRVDISTGDFVALRNVKAKDLVNTSIDVDDKVLQQRDQLQNLRQWYTTRLGEEVLTGREAKQKNDTIFTLMSYNVLAQQLLTDNQYLYSACDKKHLDWNYRWALLQHEIEDLDPDVLLLQEVQSSHYFSHFLPWFTLKGYDGVYKKRTGTKCDGCAIFVKTNKFSIVEHCTVEYYQPKAAKVLDRDNIGIIAKLAPVAKPQLAVCVATTHFLYNPKRHDVKLAQAIVLLAELDRICYEGEKNGQTKYCPAIISGDFNAEPHTAILDLMKHGRIHYEGLSSRSLTQHGTYPILGPQLLPPSLGITDRCQHAVLAQSRFVEKTTGQLFSLSDKRKIEESLIHFHNSDRSHLKLRKVSSGCNGPAPTGWFSHGFNFNSVYRHYHKRAPEATTFHNKWTTVDYILYSRVYSQTRNEPVEGSLKLLGRYGLLTGPEAHTFAPLPSAVCPSDHFPLAAQFLLRK